MLTNERSQPIRTFPMLSRACAWKTCRFWIFFFNDTATTEIYTLSLHDALPIYRLTGGNVALALLANTLATGAALVALLLRSEEHTSELQSHVNLVCRLLLE